MKKINNKYLEAINFHRNGLYEKALKNYNELQKANLNTDEQKDLLISKSALLMQMQEFEQAIPLFDEILEIDPKYYSAWYYRACCYCSIGEEKKAIIDLTQAVYYNKSLIYDHPLEKYFEPLKDDAIYNNLMDPEIYRLFSQNILKKFKLLGKPYDYLANPDIRGQYKLTQEMQEILPYHPDTLISTIQIMQKTNAIKGAKNLANLAIEKYNPYHPEFFLERAKISISLEQTQEAFSDLDIALKLGLDKGEYYFQKSLLYSIEKNQSKSLENLKKAVEHNIDYSVRASGSTYYRQIYRDNNKKMYEVLNFSKREEIAQSYYEKGLKYKQKKDYEKALHNFNLAQYYYYEALYLYQIAFVLDEMGNYEEAISICKLAIENEPEHAKIYFQMAYTLNRQKKYAEGVEAYKKAIELGKNDVTTNNNLAYALHCMGKDKEAIKYYDAALAINPSSTLALSNKTHSLRALGDLQGAIDLCSQVIAISPKNDTAWYNRGCYHCLLGKKQEALSDLEKAIELDSSYKQMAKEDEDFKKLYTDKTFIELTK